MTRPNIVVFIPDQLRAGALGCFGNPVASTPHVDALAASGTRFDQAFGQHPFCSQSRASFLTGWYPHVHGHRTLTSLLQPWQPNAFRLLKEAGYHVAHVGARGDSFAAGLTAEFTSRFGWAVRPESTWMSSPYGPDHPLGRAFYHGRRSAEGPVVDYDEACIRTAEQWLDEGLPEPWFLYVPLAFPHPPFEVEDPWFSLHDRNDVPAPLPPSTSVEPRFKSVIRERYALDRLDGDDWAEIIATYYGMVSRVDDHLGRLLQAVDRTGAEANTAVFFFPDHGEYLGDFGLVEKWASGLDPCLVRNPLIARLPGQSTARVATGLVELIDVAPTWYELAEIEPNYTHFGRSLVPLSRSDSAMAHRDAAFSEGGYLVEDAHLVQPHPFPYDLKHDIEATDPVSAGKATAMRTPEWTYVHRLYEGDELYDRRSDPAETTNVIDTAANADVLADLRCQMLQWFERTSDVVDWTPDPRFDTAGALQPSDGRGGGPGT